ncbi:MAG: glycogen debranching protein GlgX [Chlorogloeopsis fritschii C42_A2020_084]|uniref:glycogen debranching protein GlgX n=1 Tax=Chlorogloeopsis fritschii TaxID=1124 RepID=UPI001A0E37D4|nr:glycogen debranching protein GlgX [Chlorogloeopsis fritschii]MBF2007944.1 glycogen debranching protein GlgX [Chlorogloeopsis fritschii C42_A2020_084]
MTLIVDAPKITYQAEKGRPHPLGATPDREGVNFAVFSQHATGIQLLLFDKHDALEPIQIIELDPKVNKTFHFWHVYVRGLKPGIHYAYRVDGPHDINAGHRFNKNKVLIDPYAKGNTADLWNRVDACGEGDNLATSARSVVIDVLDYDWEGDRPINRPMSETIVYEMHVRGFTQSPSSSCQHPGTFLAVIEKIPYLKELGITAVELLPIFGFDHKQVLREVNGKPLTNYWGYSTVSFFAPHSPYCVYPEIGNQIREFRDMVKALHKAGIEVILDVVFNHTDEGNHLGPTINFKGFDNSIYYHLVPGNKQYYMDYTGCGNTFNCNHPIADKFILECLEFWVREMHVDGFRFDEGSILSRGEDGVPMAYPPAVWNIELSETLADTKIIAEAWDAAGLYQIGYFPGYRWAEWNGRYRDDIRRFVKGDPGLVGAVASRIGGSADIYQSSGHLPINSINFITCHDGFTLNDLVSYNYKHNEANGEDNRDGINDNLSWNCGVEGETGDRWVEDLRDRQVKNFAAILLLSQGVPMILAGDEVRHSQQGNNNAYCQDSEISWFNWQQLQKYPHIYRFFKLMIDFRKHHPILHRPRFFSGKINERGLADVSWHGSQLYHPGWNDPEARVLAFTLGGVNEEADIHVMLNMYWEGLDFEIPTVAGRQWYRTVDTSQPSPSDIAEPGKETLITTKTYWVQSRSVVVLISK